MKGLFADLKHALRLYRASPVASVLSVIFLAVAMAAVASFVSLYVDLLLRPHPGFERGNKIVTYGWNDGRNASGLPYDLIERISRDSVTLDAAAGTLPTTFQVGTEKESVIGEMVTRDFFPGVRPKLVLGRGFTDEDHDAEAAPVAVISSAYWRRHFDGRNDVLGQTIPVYGQSVVVIGPDGRPQPRGDTATDFRIVGVMSPDYFGTASPRREDAVSVWFPYERTLPVLIGDSARQQMNSITLRGVGRAARHASPAAIISELTSRFSDGLPPALSSRPGFHFDVMDGLVFNVFTQRSTTRQLRLFIGASILLALVAAANISLFLLARAPGRRRELGIRMAVGAPLKRLARQLASEAALLVVASAVLGLAVSIWFARFLRGLAVLRDAQWRDVTLFDWRVLGLVGVFLLVLTLLVSLAPIPGLKRLGIGASSRQVSARATVSQRVAGTAQIAIAGMLGGAAIAFGWYLSALIFGDPGYETRNLQAAIVLMPPANARVGDESAAAAAVVENARRRDIFLSVPGVTDVSFAGAVPGFQAAVSTQGVPDPADPNNNLRVINFGIDSRYIDLLGLRLLYGRGPTDEDVGVAVVNQKLAQQFFGRDDVVGETLPFATPGGQNTKVIGVLEDLSYQHPDADIDATAFMSTSAMSFQSVALIESTLTSAELRKGLQELVDSGKLEMTVPEITPLATLRKDILAQDRARSFLTIGTAILVVLIAAFGFYGTQRYLVTAGRREYAIRASLGAGPAALGRLVLHRGLWLGLPGLIIGLPLSFLVVALLRDDYVSRDISPALVTILVAIELAVLMIVASLGPARRARRTEPAPLLRED